MVITLKQRKKGNIAARSERCCRKNFTSILLRTLPPFGLRSLDQTAPRRSKTCVKLTLRKIKLVSVQTDARGSRRSSWQPICQHRRVEREKRCPVFWINNEN